VLLRQFTLSLALVCAVFGARAQQDTWTRAFDVMRETRWQQSGVLQVALRWPAAGDRTLKYSINAKAGKANADRAHDAVRRVTGVIGFAALEVAPASDEAQIHFDIREFTPEELRQATCFTQSSWKNFVYTKTRVVLSERFAYRCVLHELMHAMGFPGHPQGDTVLSYFEGNQSALKPVDEFMLKAWYSDAIKPGMSALNATRTLNRVWIDQNVIDADRGAARAAEQVWFDRVIASLDAFAFGKGEPPAVLYRSGRLSAQGLNIGLTTVQATLASEYFIGQVVPRDLDKALGLLLLVAQSGNGNLNLGGQVARALGSSLVASNASNAVRPLCEWLRDTPAKQSGASEADVALAMKSQACKPFVAPP
jgi:hypothetical protein